ncbi:leucine-rich repeat domain-containing protein [Nannocystaceae bacterium ST9]
MKRHSDTKLQRGAWRFSPLLLGLIAACSSLGCRGGEGEPVAQEAVEANQTDVEDSAPEPESIPRSGDPTSLLIADVATLEATDLALVERLDLALSELDAQERPLPLPEPEPTSEAGVEIEAETTGAVDPAVQVRVHPRCEGLDLHALAERAPRLRALRISGCQAAVHSGLSAFGPRLRELELVDIQLDAVTIARLSQLHGLDTLILTRVHSEPDALKPLARKISPQSLILRELADASPVAELLGILPDLRHVRIEGPWATHDTMILAGKAKRLESLAVIDTTIGNYSLHQIKPLDHLHRLEWAGVGFNDSTPLFLKELPLDELICNCTKLGDKGLHYLALLQQLRVLELTRTQISSAGLAELTVLRSLERVVIRDSSFDGDGFAALAQLPALRELILAPGVLDDPEAPHLGEILGLRTLELDLQGFDDRAAPQLASLVQLERLDLGGAAISDEGLEHLAPLVHMRELELHHTRVTKLGLRQLAGMSGLEVLELDHTDVVDEGVAQLVGLQALRELRLDHTLITDAALVHVAKLAKLERLNLADTVVTAEGVKLLAALPELESVNLQGTRASGRPDERPDE